MIVFRMPAASGESGEVISADFDAAKVRLPGQPISFPGIKANGAAGTAEPAEENEGKRSGAERSYR
ncbi:hypothetical protein GCM10023143_18360 [Compostibacter hankyongensis]|uniref:Uncharacterized protein n=1 Tax=Compostibacter hankyongensis TaxID=1007089 RepID=A0ABP8FSZ6_9BACT